MSANAAQDRLGEARRALQTRSTVGTPEEEGTPPATRRTRGDEPNVRSPFAHELKRFERASPTSPQER